MTILSIIVPLSFLAASVNSGAGTFSGALLSILLMVAGTGLAIIKSGKRTPRHEAGVPGRSKVGTPDTFRILEAVSDNFPDGLLCVLDQNLRFEFIGGTESFSPADRKKQWIGKTLSEDFHPSISQTAIADIRKVLEGREASYEVIASNHAYLVNAKPVRDSHGTITEVLVLVRNVTGRIKMENSLKKAQLKEKEFNILRSRFVTLASHEFRTPLSTILTSAFLLENYTGEDYEAEKKSYLDKIKRAVHNLTDLLNDFLSIGKLEEGK